MKILFIGIAFFAIAIGFNLWLDHGCEVSGIITSEGKQCI